MKTLEQCAADYCAAKQRIADAKRELMPCLRMGWEEYEQIPVSLHNDYETCKVTSHEAPDPDGPNDDGKECYRSGYSMDPGVWQPLSLPDEGCAACQNNEPYAVIIRHERARLGGLMRAMMAAARRTS